ncbi:MAG: efflux RND transporter periplasmic adaptor subunit [Ignavibacteriales bacterium]|nr:efflux RND transporter periplasmic adaptor subunit [Ignavibacteriales bacterium]
MKKILSFIILLSLFAINSCDKQEAAGNRKAEELANHPLPVEISIIKQTEWIEDVSTYGSVKKPDVVDIFPKMPGKLVRLLVLEGQKIKNDDVIAIVERDEVGLSFKPVEVKSTIAGKVETLYLKEGSRVSDSNPILSISKQEDLKLLVELFETDLAKVREGLEVIITLDALPNREFTGKVSLIKSNLNSHSGKGEVEITFDKNYSEIISGMFGRAGIIINRKPALAIVPDAIRRINGNRAVYVVKDGIAKLTFVELGMQKQSAVEIKKGISAGDTVITFSSDELKDGSRVKIIGGNQK